MGRTASARWGGWGWGCTCRRSSCSSRRASSRERSTSCSLARSSPESLPTATRASSKSTSFCSLSSLASFRLEESEGRGAPSPGEGTLSDPIQLPLPLVSGVALAASCPQVPSATCQAVLPWARPSRDGEQTLGGERWTRRHTGLQGDAGRWGQGLAPPPPTPPPPPTGHHHSPSCREGKSPQTGRV